MVKNCEVCSKSFKMNPSRLKNKHHCCSRVCSGKLSSILHSKKVETPCVVCNKPIYYKQSHFKQIAFPTCSYTCAAKSKGIRNKGKSNPRSLNLTEEDRYFWNKESQLRSRAAALKIDYNLDWQFLKEQFNSQQGLCYYSGLPLNKKATKSKGQAGYDALSVDKIDANKGYTKDNVVFCINSVNMMKGSFDMNIFKRIIAGLATRNKLDLKIKKLTPNAVLPFYARLGDGGMDLTATSVEYIKEHNVYKYGVGLAFQIPFGNVGMLYPRSSIFKYDLQLTNSVGILDCFYRNEVFFIFHPTKENPKIYNVGDRIGQIMIMPFPQVESIEVSELDMTNDRGGGFGSTNV